MNENKVISEQELLDAIKNLLRKSGHLNKFQAEMREKVTQALQERQALGAGGGVGGGAPAAAPEALLVNELVREYLEWSGYLYTAGVLCAEAALGGARRARAELSAALGVRDDERSAALPLLASMVHAYAERVKRKTGRARKDAK